MSVSRKYNKRRYLKGGKKSRRRKYKKSKKMRKQRRRRKRTRRHRRKRRVGGGCGCASPMVGGNPAPYKCDLPTNVGETFTGYKLNTSHALPDPKSLNQNFRAHRKGPQKGGFFMQDFGLGDVLLNWYKGTNMITNAKHTYRGAAKEAKADPMSQPELLREATFDRKTPNIPREYSSASSLVAKQTI